jgi:hypothetical protein
MSFPGIEHEARLSAASSETRSPAVQWRTAGLFDGHAARQSTQTQPTLSQNPYWPPLALHAPLHWPVLQAGSCARASRTSAAAVITPNPRSPDITAAYTRRASLLVRLLTAASRVSVVELPCSQYNRRKKHDQRERWPFVDLLPRTTRVVRVP